MKSEIIEQDYNSLLTQSVSVIEKARTQIAVQVNTAASQTYFEIGRILTERKLESKHGSAVVERLSADLKERYPKMGFSTRNLWDMKRFYLRYENSDLKLRQAVAVLPWGANLLFLNKKLDDDAVVYYAKETIAKNWTRELLLNAIKMKMHERRLPVDNNFSATLPSEQSNYANEVFKNTVNLGFLGVTEPILELDMERRIVEKVKLFLLEMGKGFTFIGNQHVLEYNGKESRVDLLLFHRGLRSLVAIDLKIGEFKPEYVGKMNYYLSLLDELEKGEDENPSIGIREALKIAIFRANFENAKKTMLKFSMTKEKQCHPELVSGSTIRRYFMAEKAYVYFMTNKTNSVLYIGVTSDLQKRVYQHKNHIYEGFTDKYNCTKLVYFEECNDITAAIQREKQLKNWHREWKNNLVEQINKDWKDLSEE